MTQHTPGPWTVRDYKNATGGIWVDCNAFANKGKGRVLGGTIGDVYDSGETQAANARLIAAAPELLAVARKLIWLAEAEENEVPDDEYENVFDQVKADARAALAKATGSP